MKPEDAWYIEWIDHTGAIRWSGFVEGYDAAWAKFVEIKQTQGTEEWKGFEDQGDGPTGRVRVGAPSGGSEGELMGFDNAFGFGPEPFVGYEDAVAKLTGEQP